MNRLMVLGLIIILGACAGPSTSISKADPEIIAKINSVCAYSGLFRLASNVAGSMIPVPGIDLGIDLINAGVDRVCLDPESIAVDIGVVKDLIAKFKAAGKM